MTEIGSGWMAVFVSSPCSMSCSTSARRISGAEKCSKTGAATEKPLGMKVPAMSRIRSEEHTSELQSLMRISYAVFCLKNKKLITHTKKDYTRRQKKQRTKQ